MNNPTLRIVSYFKLPAVTHVVHKLVCGCAFISASPREISELRGAAAQKARAGGNLAERQTNRRVPSPRFDKSRALLVSGYCQSDGWSACRDTQYTLCVCCGRPSISRKRKPNYIAGGGGGGGCRWLSANFRCLSYERMQIRTHSATPT